MLMLLSVALMTADHRTTYVDNLRASLAVLLYPLQYVVTVPGDMVNWIGESFASREQLEQDNENLHTQNQLLLARVQKFASLEAENLRLRELLQSSKQVGEQVLVADLLAVDLDPYTRQVKLNKGSRQNVFVGQPLLDAQGVMGQIIQVDPWYSVAMLITDPDHTLPVQINRNGLRAVAVGAGAEGVLQLPYLPNNTDIQVGDLLVTSGLGGVYPPGYPAAEIISVEVNPSLPFANITARPTASLDRGRQVLLVWPAQTIIEEPEPSGPDEEPTKPEEES